MLGIAVIINNYLHDVATAVLLAAAVILWVLMRRAAQGNAADIGALARAYPVLSRFAAGAIGWIVIGGIPRLAFFSRFEWDPAVTKGIVPALAVKHAMMFGAVAAGVVMWRKAAKVLRWTAEHPASSTEDA